MISSHHPTGVIAVAILLLIEAVFSLLWIIMLYTSPVMRDIVAQTTQSIPALVFLTLVNAALSLTCGIGMLRGGNWAKMLYIGYVPVIVLLAMTNGFRLTMLIGIIQYIIFVIILMLPSSVKYFTGETS